MSLHITDDRITSDEVSATAERRYWDHSHGWVVSTDPGAAYDRDGAITALTLAEELARPNPNELLVESLRSELR
jgi:type IV secretory pathway ATPase VirB11/archaellum biosynthesis ATPase